MEKEENQNSTSADQNQDTIKENEKPEENIAEELLGFKFKTAKGCISENAKSVVRLGLV